MLELTHIGEGLVCELLNATDDLHNRICDLAPSLSNKLSKNLVAVPELSLNTLGHLMFDGVHKVDICILDRDNQICFPIEAKLGRDRLSSNEFNKRFIADCGTSHNGTRVKGSMISILERRLPSGMDREPLSVSYEDKQFQLTEQWGLLVREVIHKKWEHNNFPDLSPACTYINLDRIVHEYGRDNFNALINKILQRDFYQDWGF